MKAAPRARSMPLSRSAIKPQRAKLRRPVVTPRPMSSRAHPVHQRQSALFSSTPVSASTTSPTDTTASGEDQVLEQAQKHREAMKSIIGTMNDGQQLVVKALVAENNTLRTTLQEHRQLISAQVHHNKQLARKLDEYEQDDHDLDVNSALNKPVLIDKFGKPHLASPHNTANEVDQGNYSLNRKLGDNSTADITIRQLQQDINQETDERIKTLLIRELKLRETLEPLLNILKRAAQEKSEWDGRTKKRNFALVTLVGILIGQSWLLYDFQSASAAAESAQHLLDASTTHLSETQGIIESYQRIIESAGLLRPVESHTLTIEQQNMLRQNQTKYDILQETLRIESLANNQQGK